MTTIKLEDVQATKRLIDSITARIKELNQITKSVFTPDPKYRAAFGKCPFLLEFTDSAFTIDIDDNDIMFESESYSCGQYEREFWSVPIMEVVMTDDEYKAHVENKFANAVRRIEIDREIKRQETEKAKKQKERAERLLYKRLKKKYEGKDNE